MSNLIVGLIFDIMYQKYTGIILKKHPFGEADELLTIYSRESGKIRVKAVSVRKPLSKLAGHLQSLNEIEFEVVARSKHLPVMISVRALTVNNYLRQNLRKFGFALVGIETLYRLTGDGQENLEAYNELRAFLKNLGENPDENLALRRFQLQVLAANGYAFPVETQTNGDFTLTHAGNFQLTSTLEKEIDQFIDYVLEREIKSVKVLDSLI